MDVSTLPGAWGLPRPWTIRRAGGLNNYSAHVETPSGAYVLRVYRNTADPERLRYEHALLQALQEVDLSFAVPCPLATPAGHTAVPVVFDGSGGVPAFAALFPRLPGEAPDVANPLHVSAAGAALGELHGALARVTVATTLTSQTALSLLRRTPQASGETGALRLDDLPLAPGQRSRLDGLVDRLREAVPPLYATLRQQVIHWDFDPSNVLVEGDGVTAVLDFEFATPDLRTIDLARGIHVWTGGALPDGTAWGGVEAFASGYRTRVALSLAEARGVAPLLLLGQLAELWHWVGRWRRGLLPTGAPADWIVQMVGRFLRLGDWLTAHEAELADRLITAR